MFDHLYISRSSVDFRLPPLCFHEYCKTAAKSWRSSSVVSGHVPMLCWPLVGQKSNRTRCSVLAVPCGACQVYPAHRIGGMSMLRKYSVLRKMNCQSFNRFLRNMCKLEVGRGLRSDQIWPNFHRDDIMYILDIKTIHCKISNPCLKAWRVWSISCEQK